MKKIFSRALKLCAGILVLSAAAFASLAALRARGFTRQPQIQALEEGERAALEKILDKNYPWRGDIIKPLPYKTVPARIDVNARSAILVDVASGSILYEKEADKEIPPASMAKIAVMMVVLREAKAGKISLDDIVPLPRECWACNMPPHSSLMFLGKNQIVTARELLEGLDVCSGNDAACALAFFVSGGIDAFVEKMNGAMESLGLEKTRFVEPSGYSERNVTTAREMAALARSYILEFPEALRDFHSLPSFTYPKEKNLAMEDRGKPTAQDFSKGLPENITMAITQRNTNVLLGALEGCDGLKTGYIDESGYNLALTALRDGTRFLSVTMNGPGANVLEGNKFRAADGTALMEWAFARFADCAKTCGSESFCVPAPGTREQWTRLVPALEFDALAVPFIEGSSPREAADLVQVAVSLPRAIEGGAKAGAECGFIEYSLAGRVLQKIPLVAERDSSRANVIVRAADVLASRAIPVVTKTGK